MLRPVRRNVSRAMNTISKLVAARPACVPLPFPVVVGGDGLAPSAEVDLKESR